MFCGLSRSGAQLRAAEEAERGVLLRRQRRFIDGEGGEEFDVVGEAGLAELLDEVHAHAAGQEHEHRVGRRRPRSSASSAEKVELVERHIDFVHHVALVESA